jgi:membrane fusion protein (multidrug efflux system)
MLLLAGCSLFGNNNVNEGKALSEVPVFRIVPEDIEETRDYVADIHARQNVELRSRVKGYLSAVHVDEGSWVKKGQLLFTIEPDLFHTEFAKASALLDVSEAEARVAEQEWINTQRLAEKQVVEKAEVLMVKARYDALKAKVKEAAAVRDAAAIHLAHTSVKAPFDGIVDRIPLKVGSLIDEGSLLTSISDLSEVLVYFNVSETEYLELFSDLSASSQSESTRKVSLLLADGTEFEKAGFIETMESEFDAATGALAVRARFPNPGKQLKHGSTGRIQLKFPRKKAILVPQKAIFEVLDRDYVYIITKDSIVQIRSVVPSIRHEQYYVVESGLKSGDNVVAEGGSGLKEGVKVSPIKHNE